MAEIMGVRFNSAGRRITDGRARALYGHNGSREGLLMV